MSRCIIPQFRDACHCLFHGMLGWTERSQLATATSVLDDFFLTARKSSMEVCQIPFLSEPQENVSDDRLSFSLRSCSSIQNTSIDNNAAIPLIDHVRPFILCCPLVGLGAGLYQRFRPNSCLQGYWYVEMMKENGFDFV
jgi:hypothetical protein